MSRLAAALARGATAAALLISTSSSGQDVTLEEARAAAERVAPDVLLAMHRSGLARAEVDVAGALVNPTVTMTTATETARLGTSVALPLPLFGQRATSVRAAKADAEAAFLDIAVVRREARWRATVAWIDLWEAQNRASLLDLAAKDADRLFQIASEKFDAGTGPRLDVVRTSADRARAAAETEAARRLAMAAAARLAPWIGAPAHSSLSAAGAPEHPANLPAMDAIEARLVNHPALRRDRAQIAAARLHVENEQRLRWPVVIPQLTVDQFDPSLSGPDFIVGLSFELPALNLRGGAIARARAQHALAEAVTSADERRLHADLLDAYRRTEAAGTKLRALRDQVLPAIKQARDMTEEGYRSGRIDLLRVLEAQKAYLDNRVAETEALAAWGRAVADLEKAGPSVQETTDAP